jgi:hypothetical protein
MKGLVEIIVGEDTITEALQEYFDIRLGLFSKKVLSISPIGPDGYAPQPPKFSIKLDAKPPVIRSVEVAESLTATSITLPDGVLLARG